jgi:hypothetical protein
MEGMPIFLHQMQREWQASAAGVFKRKSFEKNYLEMNFLSLTTLIARDRNHFPSNSIVVDFDFDTVIERLMELRQMRSIW